MRLARDHAVALYFRPEPVLIFLALPRWRFWSVRNWKQIRCAALVVRALWQVN